MISVLLEGMKDRKSGSHELNKDYSRSHSIMTIYIISDISQRQQSVKKYGKNNLVDLTGSERLKESKSQGDIYDQRDWQYQ
jgi:hypothetical protein